MEVNFGGLQEIEKSGQYEIEQTTVTDFDGKDVSNYFNFYYIYDAKGNKTIRFQAKKILPIKFLIPFYIIRFI